jgi:hypothetical protein
MIEANTWYYTLSTIAQTLAAILALGGTFIVFKLDRINERIKNLRDIAIETIMIFQEKLTQSFDDTSDKKILQQMKDFVDRLDIEKENWGITSNQKTSLAELYRNREFNSRIGPSRTPLDEEVIIFIRNKSKRFGTDIGKVGRVLRMLKYSLSLLSVTIIASVFVLPLQNFFKFYDIEILLIIVSFAVFSIYIQGRVVWLVAYE